MSTRTRRSRRHRHSKKHTHVHRVNPDPQRSHWAAGFREDPVRHQPRFEGDPRSSHQAAYSEHNGLHSSFSSESTTDVTGLNTEYSPSGIPRNDHYEEFPQRNNLMEVPITETERYPVRIENKSAPYVSQWVDSKDPISPLARSVYNDLTFNLRSEYQSPATHSNRSEDLEVYPHSNTIPHAERFTSESDSDFRGGFMFEKSVHDQRTFHQPESPSGAQQPLYSRGYEEISTYTASNQQLEPNNAHPRDTHLFSQRRSDYQHLPGGSEHYVGNKPILPLMSVDHEVQNRAPPLPLMPSPSVRDGVSQPVPLMSLHLDQRATPPTQREHDGYSKLTDYDDFSSTTSSLCIEDTKLQRHSPKGHVLSRLGQKVTGQHKEFDSQRDKADHCDSHSVSSSRYRNSSLGYPPTSELQTHDSSRSSLLSRLGPEAKRNGLPLVNSEIDHQQNQYHDLRVSLNLAHDMASSTIQPQKECQPDDIDLRVSLNLSRERTSRDYTPLHGRLGDISLEPVSRSRGELDASETYSDVHKRFHHVEGDSVRTGDPVDSALYTSSLPTSLDDNAQVSSQFHIHDQSFQNERYEFPAPAIHSSASVDYLRPSVASTSVALRGSPSPHFTQEGMSMTSEDLHQLETSVEKLSQSLRLYRSCQNDLMHNESLKQERDMYSASSGTLPFSGFEEYPSLDPLVKSDSKFEVDECSVSTEGAPESFTQTSGNIPNIEANLSYDVNQSTWSNELQDKCNEGVSDTGVLPMLNNEQYTAVDTYTEPIRKLSINDQPASSSPHSSLKLSKKSLSLNDMSIVAGGNEKHNEDVLNMAKIVIGEELARHLDLSGTKNNLLHHLFSACKTIVSCVSNKLLFPRVAKLLDHHLKGFYSGSMSSGHIPANAKVLFTKELSHLRFLCGKNITKWKGHIQQFSSFASSLPCLLEEGKEENMDFCSSVETDSMDGLAMLGDEGKVSPKPLIVDVDLTEPYPVYPPISSQSDLDFVGYRKYTTEKAIGESSRNALTTSSCQSNESNRTSMLREKSLYNQEIEDSNLPAPNSTSQRLTFDSKPSQFHPTFPSSLPEATFNSQVNPLPVNLQLCDTPNSLPTVCEVLDSEQVESQKKSSPLLVTSTIPVHSPRQTAKGLQSLLDIVHKGVVHVQDQTVKELSTADHISSTSACDSTPSSLLLAMDKDSGSDHTTDHEESQLRFKSDSNVPNESFIQSDYSSVPTVQADPVHDSRPVGLDSIELQPPSNSKPCSEEHSEKHDVSHGKADASSLIPKDSKASSKPYLVSPLKEISVDSSPKHTELGPGQSTQEESKEGESRPRNRSLSPGEIVSSSPSPSPPPMLKQKPKPYGGGRHQREVSNAKVQHRERSAKRRAVDDKWPASRFRTRVGSTYGSRYRRRPSPPLRPNVISHSHPKDRRRERYRSTKVQRENKSSTYKPKSRDLTSVVKGKDRRYSSSESEEELELLDLRKKALMSMIPEDSAQKDVNSSESNVQDTSNSSQHDNVSGSTAPLVETAAQSVPCPVESGDNFDLVDMDVCNTCSGGEEEKVVSSNSDDHTNQPIAALKEDISKSDLLNTCSLSHQKSNVEEKPFPPSSQGRDNVQLISDKLALTEASKSPTTSVLSTHQEVSTAAVSSDSLSPARSNESPLLTGRVTPPDKLKQTTRTPSPSFSVTILPGNEKTWNIEPVHIVPESDTDSGHSDTGIDSTRSPQTKKSSRITSDISQFLLEARKASENSAVSVKQSPAALVVDKTVPPLLPTTKKKEYLQLKLKLEMHERRKQLKNKSHNEMQRPPSKAHVSSSSRTSKGSSLNHKSQKEDRTTAKPKASQGQNPPQVNRQREESVQRLRQTLSKYEEELQNHQVKHAKYQSELNSLTDQMTDCELNIDETDLKLEALETQLVHLKKQIETAKAFKNKAHQRKIELQNEVRLVRENFALTDRKLKEVKAEIEQAKTSLTGLNLKNVLGPKQMNVSLSQHASNAPVSAASHSSPLSSEDCSQASSAPSTSSKRIPEILIEPISDVESNYSHSPSPAVGMYSNIIEPISDSEGSDSRTYKESIADKQSSLSVGQAGYHSVLSSVVLEAVSDSEVDSTASVACPQFTTTTNVTSKVSIVSPSDNSSVVGNESQALQPATLPTSQLASSGLISTESTPRESSYCMSPANGKSVTPVPTNSSQELRAVQDKDKLIDLKESSGGSDEALTKTSKNEHVHGISSFEAKAVPLSSNTNSASCMHSNRPNISQSSRISPEVPTSNSLDTDPPTNPAVNLCSGDASKVAKVNSTESDAPNESLTVKESDVQNTLSSELLPSIPSDHLKQPSKVSLEVSELLSSSMEHKAVVQVDTGVFDSTASAAMKSDSAIDASSSAITVQSHSFEAATIEDNSSAQVGTKDVTSGIPTVPLKHTLTSTVLDDKMPLSEYKSLPQQPDQPLDEQLVGTDEIFHAGTSDLFTLGYNEPPQYVVPTFDLDSHFSLEVDPDCIEEGVLNEVQTRWTLSYITRTGSGAQVSKPLNSDENSSPATSSCLDSLNRSTSVSEEQDVGNNMKSPTCRSRKQKKPLKLTPDLKLKFLHRDNKMDVSGTESSMQEFTDSTTSSNPHGLSEKRLDELDILSDHVAEGSEMGNTKMAARKREQEVTASSSQQKRKRPLPVAATTPRKSKRSKTSDKSRYKDSNSTPTKPTVAPVLSISSQSYFRISKSDINQAVSVFQAVFQKRLPESTPLTVDQVQQLLLYVGPVLPVQSTTYSQSLPLLLVCQASGDSMFAPRSRSKSITNALLPTSMLAASKNSSSSSASKSSGYVPYSSPLLSFSSYLLNPAYRQHEKLQLGSATYSNKLDPKQILCKFETLGVCKDPKCSAQHIRDVQLSKKEVVVNLVSNAPGLAKCTSSELCEAESTQPSLKKVIAGKLSAYASSVVDRYSPKLSDEEIYRLTAHEVNKARRKDMKGLKKDHFVSFVDQDWLTARSLSVQSVRENAAGPSVSVNTAEVELFGLDFSEPAGSFEMTSHSHHNTPKWNRRYFSPKISPGKPAVYKPMADSVEHWIESASDLVKQKKYTEALKNLEDGLAKHQSSVVLWVNVLRLHSYIKETTRTVSGEPSLSDVCTRALNASKSYAVILKCISVGKSYTWKQEWIAKGIKMISTLPHSAITSHQCVELLLNSVLLSACMGRLDLALGTMEVALFGSSTKPFIDEFKNVSEHLTLEDRQLVCLCNIHLVYWQCVPTCVFSTTATSTVSIPSQIVSKVFCVEWDMNKRLTHSEAEAMRVLFQKSLQQCQLVSEVTSESVKVCLPLLKSVTGFEVTHGDPQRAVVDIESMIDLTPSVVELWLLCVRSRTLVGLSSGQTLLKATNACPGNAQLYYLAARLELSTLSRGPTPDVTQIMQKAVKWLEDCVKTFYRCEASTQPVESLLLYRKLLGQLVPYDLQIPQFADNVNPKQLGPHLTPLWMCYCLLVELTTPGPLNREFYHQSAVEAYESAVHSVLHRDGSMCLWREYLCYLRSCAVRNANSTDNVRAFLDCTRRCLLAIDHTLVNPHAVHGQPGHYEDYSFHNEMMDLFLDSLQCTPSQNLSLLQAFGSLLPNNSLLLAKIVSCALEQDTPCVELAQSLLATYLAKFPFDVQLWRMAISIEVKLGRSREARWMYQQAVDALPHCLLLWTNFLAFELRECMDKPHSDPASTRVATVLSKALQYGVDLHTAFPTQSSS